MSVKPWQVVVMVAGLGAGVFGVMSAMRGGGPEFADSTFAIDVMTGQMYRVSLDTALYFPAKSPEDGERTVFPIVDRDGQWFVSGLNLPRLQNSFEETPPAVMDRETGLVQSNGSEPVRFVREN